MSLHIPILAEPIVEALTEPFLKLSVDAPSHWLVDCTLGGGGHCGRFLEKFSKNTSLQKHKVLAMDKDQGAVERAQAQFKDYIQDGRLEILHETFGNGAAIIRSRPVLGLLADFGFSSDQLEDPARGLSFQTEGPLDMRLDQTQGSSAQQLLYDLSERELEKILREYGEERFAKSIAAKLVALRRNRQLPTTTKELSQAVVQAIPPGARHQRIHAATRTFQALRIAVNDELVEVERLLQRVIPEVQSGGRVAILSFHSLEDRQVKNTFKNREIFVPLTKKPQQADEAEMKANPRSRSAKLRIAERVARETSR